MADNTIDVLSLEIKSNAAHAEQSIKKLTEALIKLAGGAGRGLGGLRTAAGDIRALNDATKTLNGDKLVTYAKGMNDLSESVGRFANIGDKITPAVTALGKLSGIDLSGLKVNGDYSGLSSLAEGASRLADVAPKLAALKAVDLNRSLNVFQKLGATDFTGVTQSLSTLNGLDASGFVSLSDALNTFSGSAEKLAALGRKDMNTAIRNIERMGAINFGGLAQGMSSLAGVDFSQMAALGQVFQSFSNSLAGADKIASGTVRIFSSLSQLTASAQNIPLITANLPALSTELQTFVSSISTAPAISSGTIVLVSALSGIAGSGAKAQKAAETLPAISSAIRSFIDSMSGAPAVNSNVIQLVRSLAQFTQQGGRASSISGSLQGQFNALSRSTGRLQLSIKSISNGFKSFTRQLLSAMGVYVGIYGAVRGLQKSVKTFSDLVEIQNVVSKSFGEMTQKVEDLSKVSIQDFGMSELTVKNIASRYQAMGVAMGFAQDEMSDMSIELTKLAADMASFYNVEQKMVSEKLESIFTGTTRPLRTFGLDLSQTTLQAWALKNGINADVKSMTQMEKTLLRYQYVMAQTRSISGDFKDTQLSMANQLRILTQSFEQLASVIGGALVNAFKPLVISLNRAMQSIIAFAQIVVNALGKIFGWTYEIKGGGVASDFEDAGAGAEEMADGTGAAKDNLKKMQKYIAAWHEVNNMTTKDDDDGGGGGGGGGLGDGLAGAAAGQLVRTEGIFDKYKSEIDTLYELGDYIGKVLTKAMNNIDWSSVYESARNFGKGLADFLNGLISPELFGAVGRTIAGALNTAVYAALSFGERFDWKDFGISIATGINEFFKTFDFGSLAQTINVWAKGMLNTIITVLGNIKWEEIGAKIGTFLEEIDFLEIGAKMGQALWRAINGGIVAWEHSFAIAPIETTIFTAVAALKFTKLGKLLSAKLGAAIVMAFKDTSVLTILKTGVSALFGNSAASGALAFINPVAVTITGIGTALAGVIVSASNFMKMWKDGFTWLNEAFMGFGIAVTALGAVILGAPALATASVAGIVAAIGTLAIAVHDNWTSILDWFTGIPEWFEINVILPVSGHFSDLCDTVSGFFSTLWQGIQSVWGSVAGWFGNTVVEPVTGFFEGFYLRSSQIFDGFWILAQAIWKVASGWFSENVVNPVVDRFLYLKDTVSGFFESLWEGIQAIWSVVSGWFNTNVIDPVAGFFRSFAENVYDLLSRLWSNVQGVWGSVSGWFSNTVIKPLVNSWKIATESISGFFTNLWTAIKRGASAAINAVIGAVERGCNFIVGSVNDILSGFNSLVAAAAKVAGLEWGGVDLIPEVRLPRVPALAKGGIVSRATLAMVGENGKEAVVPLEKNLGWIDNLSERISDNVAERFGSIQLDLSVPQMPDYKPQLPDMGSLKDTVQMEMDAKMAQMEFENRQLRASVEQNTKILEQILSKGIVLDDNEFTSRYKSAATKFMDRHHYEMGLYPAGR